MYLCFFFCNLSVHFWCIFVINSNFSHFSTIFTIFFFAFFEKNFFLFEAILGHFLAFKCHKPLVCVHRVNWWRVEKYCPVFGKIAYRPFIFLLIPASFNACFLVGGNFNAYFALDNEARIFWPIWSQNQHSLCVTLLLTKYGKIVHPITFSFTKCGGSSYQDEYSSAVSSRMMLMI